MYREIHRTCQIPFWLIDLNVRFWFFLCIFCLFVVFVQNLHALQSCTELNMKTKFDFVIYTNLYICYNVCGIENNLINEILFVNNAPVHWQMIWLFITILCLFKIVVVPDSRSFVRSKPHTIETWLLYNGDGLIMVFFCTAVYEKWTHWQCHQLFAHFPNWHQLTAKPI